MFIVLSVAAAGAQPFLRYSDGPPPVPDSSQQIADRIVKSEIPVVVDFWAAWCAPCSMLEPVIDELEKAYHGRVLFIKVNADYNRRLAAHLGVQGIPAVFFIKDKAVRQMLVGVRPEADYRRVIDGLLAPPSATEQQNVKARNGKEGPDTAAAEKHRVPAHEKGKNAGR
jgi:thioredoxin 1